MTNLLAICTSANGPAAIKRVQISQPLQALVGGLFEQQATDFLSGVEEEIPFGGDWKPDADEVLVIDAPVEIGRMREALADPIALDTVDTANFMGEGIKGLFVGVGEGEHQRIYIQSFSAQQFLARTRMALIFEGNVFRQITEPSFALETKLVAIAESGQLKFKSYHFLKRIFALEELYRAATNEQIDAFCAHPVLDVPDIMAFKAVADQSIRKLVSAVGVSNILNQTPVVDILSKAQALGVNIQVENGRIIFPAERRQIKELLRFLDDSIYEGPLSARRLITNSKRVFGAA